MSREDPLTSGTLYSQRRGSQIMVRYTANLDNRLIPNEGGWRGWRVGLGVGVEVFT